MNYTEAIGYIHSRLRFGSRPGLNSMERITERCGINLHSGVRFVHVAGTNGKGSTATMLYNMLRAAGYRTGLYISPFVTEFCERIQFDGRNISHDRLADIIGRIKPQSDALEAEGIILTEFELITAAALMYYNQVGADYVVLEVGMGGRLDATNIIDCPEVSVITHIDIDHSAVLGDTLCAIAGEKCGIIKGGVTVSYPNQHCDVAEVIARTCRERGSRLVLPDLGSLQMCQQGVFGSSFDYCGHSYRLPLIGQHQALNAITAIETAGALGLSSEAIFDGIAATVMPARLEVISYNPLVILDGSHNPDGMSALADSLHNCLGGRRAIFVIGMLADKDVTAALKHIAPLCQHAVTVTVPNPRTMSAGELAQLARPILGSVTAARSRTQAMRLAAELAGERPIVVCGSLYLASAIRPQLLRLYK